MLFCVLISLMILFAVDKEQSVYEDTCFAVRKLSFIFNKFKKFICIEFMNKALNNKFDTYKFFKLIENEA